jgi:hypothetical protein
MKKKLINFDAFKALEKNSVTNSQKELAESAEILANVLGQQFLDLYCVNEDNATYINNNGDFVYANYQIVDDKILLENIENLIVDKDTTRKTLRTSLEKMVDNILEDKLEEASLSFSEYFATPMLRAELKEGTINEVKKGGKMPPWLKAFKDKKAKKSDDSCDDDKSSKMKRKKKKDHLHKGRLHKVGNKMPKVKKESLNLLSNNILEYITFKENGNVYSDVHVKKDAHGNVVSVRIPTARLRNEGAVLKAQSEKHNRYIQENREKAKMVVREGNWVKAVTDIKRFNALSDSESLQNAFENIAAAWPQLLFLTESELATNIKITLENSGATNFDDNTCMFLAEGVLRTSHKAYTDNVGRICSSVGKLSEANDYSDFAVVAETALKKAEGDLNVETQIFSDLYRGLTEVYRTAERMGDEATKAETASLLNDVEMVMNNEENDKIRIAEEAALYLQTISEASMSLDGSTWQVATPHISDTGDNPQLAKNAAMSDAIPSKHTGPYKSSPFSDGKTIKAGSEEFFTDMKGKDLFPNMENPYAPKAGEFKMHGEKSIEDDKEYTKYSGADVFPSLKNPYLPADGMTMQDSLRHLKSSE